MSAAFLSFLLVAPAVTFRFSRKHSVVSNASETSDLLLRHATDGGLVSDAYVVSADFREKHDSSVIVLTILGLIGFYMGLATRMVEAEAIMARDSAFDRAGAVMTDVLKSYKMFRSFYDSLKDDLEQMPAQWQQLYGNPGDLEKMTKLLPYPKIDEDGLNPISGTDVDKLFRGDVQVQGEHVAWTLVGLSSPVVGTATGIFGFAMSLRSLSKAILSHQFTSEDNRYIAQTEMFQMMLRAQEANAYKQFCTFVKVTWEQAMADQMTLQASMNSQSYEFNQEKARHVAGEMQRMWRCHCLEKVDQEGCVHCRTGDHEYYRRDDAIALELVFDTEEGQALFAPEDGEGLRLLVNRFPKQEQKTRKFTTDIQVVHRECPKQASMCTGRCKKPNTAYEDKLKRQGYKLLTPELPPSETIARRLAKRSKDCLAAAKDSRTQMADVQQQSAWRGHGVVLLYVKENEGENDIPINMLKVVYGKDNADRYVSNGWTLLPMPLYHNTYYSSRLNARTKQPFIVFVRSRPVVPCPRVPPEMEQAHDCCEVPKPESAETVSLYTVSTLPYRWCEYKAWVRKDISRIKGYEHAIRHVFPALDESVANYGSGRYCEDTLTESTTQYSSASKDMWLKGCMEAMFQIEILCRKMEDQYSGPRYMIAEGILKNVGFCTGRAFLEEGDPMWRDPSNHSAGRQGYLKDNLILAASVYGSTGLSSTCTSSNP